MIKSVTIKDVAEKAGVSKGSVWAALKSGKSGIRLAPATRERILKVAREMNYRPNIVAQSMVSRKSYLIGFNFSCNNNLWHHAVQIINGLRACCKAAGYSLVVYPANNVDEEYQNLQQAVNRQLDGLLTIPLLTGSRHNSKEYLRIAKEHMPVVQVCFPLCSELSSITHDFKYIAERATEYLIERGHQNIVLVTFDNYLNPQSGITSYEHNLGYRSAMERVGLNARTFSHEAHVFKHSADDAYQIADKVLELVPRPTAIVASSNSAAFGMVKRWEELGVKVPEDISIIGCADDLDIPECLRPELTSFRTEFDDIGKNAFQLCLDQGKSKKPEHIRIKLKMLTGKTVKDCQIR